MAANDLRPNSPSLWNIATDPIVLMSYPASMQRKIIHIDADCFYAAIEMRDRTELRRVPMAVGGSAERRGVLTTCNYDARAFGVRSAMPTAHALRLCPQLVVVSPQMHKYRQASKEMRSIFAEFTNLIEPVSLDEAYLDVSHPMDKELSATRIAKTIRARVSEELSITVSAGVSVNKFVAKVASDWDKPDGLTVVRPGEVDAFIGSMPVKKIPGVGAVTAEKMCRYGLLTCADIRDWSLHDLRQRFGKFGFVLHERARGRDERPVKPSRIRKSISVERTFSEDLSGPAIWEPYIDQIFAHLLDRIDSAEVGESISKAFIKLKFNDFSTTTVERIGTRAAQPDYHRLLLEGWQRRGLPVRLIGLGVRLKDAIEYASEHLPFDSPSNVSN